LNIKKYLKMTRETKITKLLERVNPDSTKMNKMLTPKSRQAPNEQWPDDSLLFCEIEEAVTEDDVQQLRAQIQTHLNEAAHQPGTFPAKFNLADENLSGYFHDKLPLLEELLGNTESLPRIHLNNHHRYGDEVVHQFYKEVQNQQDQQESFEDAIASDEWAEMEIALQESDVISLRESLNQISQGASYAHDFSLEAIEDYIDGNLSARQIETFEQEMSLNHALSREIELVIDLDDALSEKDILDLRESIHIMMKKETSTSFTLQDIEEFIHNELESESRDFLANEFFNNPDLRAELNLLREVDDALTERDVAELRNTIRNVAENARITEEKSLVPGIKGFYRVRTVAAIFILLMGMSVMIRYLVYPADSLTQFYEDTPTALTSFRSAVPDLNSQLSIGFEQYNNADYDRALATFQQVLDRDNNNLPALYYKGASYHKLRDFSGAVRVYSEIIEHKNNIFYEQAEWYKGICLLQLGENEQVVFLMEAIIAREGFYKNKAGILLKSLKRKV
jgi:tetratricopeptide (TPR) repeat protein